MGVGILSTPMLGLRIVIARENMRSLQFAKFTVGDQSIFQRFSEFLNVVRTRTCEWFSQMEEFATAPRVNITRGNVRPVYSKDRSSILINLFISFIYLSISVSLFIYLSIRHLFIYLLKKY